MMRRPTIGRLAALVLSLLVVSTTLGWGFELDTHREITTAAFSRSRVADALREDLAVDPLRRLSGGFLRGSRVPVDWVVKGALDEDDILSINPLRFRNHFYDPVNNRGLNARGILGEAAPDWALEDREEFATQAFSYRDARRAFLISLTAPSPGEREAALAATLETLGHVIHLSQDMASPPHTRNDIHGGFIFGPKSLYELHLNQPDVLRRLNFIGEPVRFSLPREYWVTGDGRGLAEFTNRNFVSDGTNFTARADRAIGGRYPSPVLHLGADEQGRPFETTLDIQAQLEPGLRDHSGNLIQGSVTFFANNSQDPIDGVPLRNERMTTLSLFDRELERKGAALLFTLNRYNIEAQAAFLIPRAVGYSAGLLDYFFRGRLDVDLIEADPTDPSILRLSGTNASPDTLAGGTLTLYADVPAADPTQPPVRTPATALDPDLTVTAASGLPVVSGRFQVPEAERFVAVYAGKLGEEAPSGSFPGAVIGKVLGGVRVEEVFEDSEEWKIRTLRGVFGLEPRLLVAEYEQVKWGDGPNTLVARTAFGPGKPNRLATFEVSRAPNSADLATVDTPDGPRVPTTAGRSAVLPAEGIPTGTTVDFNQIWNYRQRMVRVQEITYTFRCQNGAAVGPPAIQATPPQLETLETAVGNFTLTFGVVLDADHYFTNGFPSNYAWQLVDVAADPSGRLVGLVLVYGTFPDLPTVPFTRYIINRKTGAKMGYAPSFLFAAYPQGSETFLWALINFSDGQVITSTAEPTISISYQKVSEASPLVWPDGGVGVAAHTTVVACETSDLGWGIIRASLPPGQAPVVTLQTDERIGDEGLALNGLLRKDLRTALSGAEFADSQIGTIERAESIVYLCLQTDPVGNCQAVEVRLRFSGVSRDPAFLEDARRPSAAIAGERIVLLAKDYTAPGIPVAAVAVMEANPPRSAVGYQPRVDFARLSSATATLALVIEEDFSAATVSTVLISLDGSRAPIFLADEDLSNSFKLLDPSFLYNVNDLKFYRLKPPLQRSALPAALAAFAGNPIGEYHAIRVP